MRRARDTTLHETHHTRVRERRRRSQAARGVGAPLSEPEGAGRARPRFHKDLRCRSLLGVGCETALNGAALVAEELRVHALGLDVALAEGLPDAVAVLLGSLVVGGVVL